MTALEIRSDYPLSNIDLLATFGDDLGNLKVISFARNKLFLFYFFQQICSFCRREQDWQTKELENN